MRYLFIAGITALIVIFGLLQLKQPQGTYAGTNGKVGWESDQDAAVKAADQNKKLMVYVFTEWCSWCKKMEGEVFTDDRVADRLRESYIALAINAESNRKITFNRKEFTEKQLAQMLGVRGFPTTVFLASNAEQITLAPGFIPPDRFASVLVFIGDDHYQTMSWNDFINSRGG